MKLAIWVKGKDGRYKVNSHLEIADKMHLLRKFSDGSLGCTMGEKLDDPALHRLIEEHREHFMWVTGVVVGQGAFLWKDTVYKLRADP